MSLDPQIRKMTEDQQNQVYIEMIQIVQKVKTSNNSDQIQPQSIPSSINNSTFQPLQYSYNNSNSYPTYPFNFHLPTTSYISSASPTPSTNTNMPINYEPHNIAGNNSNIHRHQVYYPHTQSSALTPQLPVTPNNTATVNSYYSQKNSPHTESSTTSVPTGHSDNSYYTKNLTPYDTGNTNSQ
ncbi:hypha-specific G1 cyclin-related protein 1-like [Myzus persicae]|uniref:hypha-specific G1 cyclin-related protein 1-like n=1 Tax=Myzus persicae TaxID=13164 RepID=UPI000B9343DA|nr:hypha-specific G1 cyclin-related protein 1-like [Myzus persicae]